MAKRLIVCCDGTWNRPDQLSEGVAAPTNVAKIALGVARADDVGTPQRLFYQPGVGTRRYERITGGAFGIGLSRNVRECYRFLVDNYAPGDELWFFGFSRGAFTARSTVGLTRNAGILRPENVDRIDDAYALYRSGAKVNRPRGREAELFRRSYSHPDMEIHFIGVWDTVGALGIPIDGLRLPLVTRLWRFHDTTLSSHVTYAYQALAIDERRGPFKPTLWEQQPEAVGKQTLDQVWFAGVHSDVGGGYAEPELAEIPLLWMVDRARRAGLMFDRDHFLPPADGIDADRRCRGEQVAPNALGRIHDSLKGFYRLLPRFRRPLDPPPALDERGRPLGPRRLAVASSAVRRRRELSDYDPPGLGDFLAAGKPVEAVEDGGRP